jgi:hypothetical protein
VTSPLFVSREVFPVFLLQISADKRSFVTINNQTFPSMFQIPCQGMPIQTGLIFIVSSISIFSSVSPFLLRL